VWCEETKTGFLNIPGISNSSYDKSVLFSFQGAGYACVDFLPCYSFALKLNWYFH
jgi:hypothetical protein